MHRCPPWPDHSVFILRIKAGINQQRKPSGAKVKIIKKRSQNEGAGWAENPPMPLNHPNNFDLEQSWSLLKLTNH
jgi:hypothetical protein